MLAPVSHSIPAKEEVPITERAPDVTLSSLFPLPCTKTPAPTPPALPSKVTLPFVPEFGEYKGGSSSLLLSQIFVWDIWLPIHQHPSHGCCTFLLVSLFLCPCCGLFLLYPLSCLLGLRCQGDKTWAGGLQGRGVRPGLGVSGHARCGLEVWVQPLLGQSKGFCGCWRPLTEEK